MNTNYNNFPINNFEINLEKHNSNIPQTLETNPLNFTQTSILTSNKKRRVKKINNTAEFKKIENNNPNKNLKRKLDCSDHFIESKKFEEKEIEVKGNDEKQMPPSIEDEQYKGGVLDCLYASNQTFQANEQSPEFYRGWDLYGISSSQIARINTVNENNRLNSNSQNDDQTEYLQKYNLLPPSLELIRSPNNLKNSSDDSMVEDTANTIDDSNYHDETMFDYNF